MGAVAPLLPWEPEDDLLLKNAIEGGASLESLAKGAVCFSRRFTFQELSDRWRCLLYDKDTSEVASMHMMEFELSSSNEIKSSKIGLKGKESSFKRRHIYSLRSHYYSMRKRIRSDPCQFDDFTSYTLPGNNGCIEHMELPHNKNMFGNTLESQMDLDYQIQDVDITIRQGVLNHVLSDDPDCAVASESFQIDNIEDTADVSHPNHMSPPDDAIPSDGFGKTRIYNYGEDISPVLMDEGVERPCELVEVRDASQILEGIMNYDCSNLDELNPAHVMQLNNHDAKSNSILSFNLPNDSPTGICPTLEGHNMKSESLDHGDTISLHHLEFSSPLPDLPLWVSVEETSTMVELDKECKITASTIQGRDSDVLNPSEGENVPVEPPLEGENAVRQAEGGFDGSFFIDIEGLDGVLNSSVEALQNLTENIVDPKAIAITGESSAVPNDIDFREAKNEDIQPLTGHDGKSGSPSILLNESSITLLPKEPSKGFVFCPLNTEDPEIPCNDDIFPPETGSPISSNLVGMSDLASLAPQKISADGKKSKSSLSSITKEGQEHYLQRISSLKNCQAAQTLPAQLSDSVKADLMGSGFMAGSSDIPGSGFDPDARTVGVPKEDLSIVCTQDSVFLDMTTDPHLENTVEGSYRGNMAPMDMDENSKLVMELPSVLPASIAACKELISPELGPGGQLPDMSSSDHDDKLSDVEDEVPSFSDVEAMILDMDLFPYDEESSFYAREASKYQPLDARKKIIRLEHGTRSCLLRTIAFQGALAVFYGYRLKHYLRKPEVLIGRSTEEVCVDIDLSEEGRANKISRRQAIIVLDESGSFSLKNLGRFSLLVNGNNLVKGQSCILTSGSLIEIRGMWFKFEINPDTVRQYLLTLNSIDKKKDPSFKLHCFKKEI